MYNFTLSCTSPWGNQDLMVWGSCPGCHSGCHRASPKLVGSWFQVLSESLCLCFFSRLPRNADTYKSLPQGGACLQTPCLGREPLVSNSECGFGLLICMGTYSHWHRIKFKLPLSKLTAQQPNRQAASFLLTALWFCYISGLTFFLFFSESGYIFLISSNLYLVVLKKPQDVNLHCQLGATFNFQNIPFF